MLGSSKNVNTKSEFKINDIAIYPNPSKGIFNLYLNLENIENQDIRINITNPLGKLIFTKIFENKTGECQELIDLSDKAKGLYNINIIYQNKITNQILIIE